MAEKISVYVIVPECNEKFNFLVPQTMKISAMRELVADILCKENRLAKEKRNSCFINLSTGNILRDDNKIENSGIFDGTELFLIGR